MGGSGHCHHVNHWKSSDDDHINRSTQGHWHHTTHGIFPQTSESWQFGNCGPTLVLGCHVLHSGTIVMAAHARSWGAIDPALRPPLSSVPPRTMAGAFYSSPVFPKQPPARSQTTYAGQDPCHFASHRLENEDHPKDFLNRFPCIHPVMHLSVTLLKNWNNISNQILHFFSNFCQFPNRRHQSHCGG